MALQIRRAAVVGAGTMGAALAGLIAGAGIPVLLLDLPPETLTPEEQAQGLTLDHPTVRNRIVQQGFERMRQARPANLYSERTTQLITLGNTADHFDRLAEADWILEAIIEQIGPKRELMARIDAVRKPGSLVTTNTSGIPISEIGAGYSADLRAHFFGTHFFNPPRYLKLVELIPGPDTDRQVLAWMRTFLERGLGKGVVVCKDRPNFIANRLGTFSLLNDLQFALEYGYRVEEVDALTGPLIGRPATATFRLLDLIGIDLMHFIAQHLYASLPDDECRALFGQTDLLKRLIAADRLGNKRGQGFYMMVQRTGKREFHPLDLETLEYVSPPTTPPFAAFVEEMQTIRSLPDRLRSILERARTNPDDRAAQLIAHTTLPLLAYAARRLPEITSSVADVDNAMRWGFNHELGPFELWQALGVPAIATMMRERGLTVAPWVEALIVADTPYFYRQQDGQRCAYDVESGTYQPPARDERALNLAVLKTDQRILHTNSSATLLDLGDGVLCLEFHSKANTIDRAVIELGLETLNELKHSRWVGLVIGNQGRHFSVGANLVEVATAIEHGQFDLIEEWLRHFQRWTLGLRYAPRPVVSAPFNRAIGGGAEVAWHSDRTVAAAETMIGLVEVGVGLIPGAGGCKELNRRLIADAANTPGGDPLVALRQAFMLISQMRVSSSAHEARDLGLLRPNDLIVMNSDHVLGEAKYVVLKLIDGYRPPSPGNHCYALGQTGLSMLHDGIDTAQTAGQISAYDSVIAHHLAYVLCGGDHSGPRWVTEQTILDLERQAFMALCREPRTLERIHAMLKTGKPLRN